jgi:hypothetical protein
MPIIVEPFESYAKLGHGIPFLRVKLNRKTGSVEWGDGSLLHYPQFARALDSASMETALMAVWDRYKAQCNRRAEFVHGGMHGCMVWVPREAVEQAATIVREHFDRALDKLRSSVVGRKRFAL